MNIHFQDTYISNENRFVPTTANDNVFILKIGFPKLLQLIYNKYIYTKQNEMEKKKFPHTLVMYIVHIVFERKLNAEYYVKFIIHTRNTISALNTIIPGNIYICTTYLFAKQYTFVVE